MALYLLEMDLEVSTPEKRATIFDRVDQVVKAGGSPNARLIAGPWASHERPKLWAVLDDPDLLQSFPARIELYNLGLVTNVRLHPIATWEETTAAAARVPGQ